MYEYIKIGAAFVVGVGAGVLGTRKYFQTKYDKICTEEIESVREAMSHRSGHIIEETSIEKPKEFADKLLKEADNGEIRVYSTLNSIYDTKAKLETESNEVKEYIEDLLDKEHPEDDRPEDCYEISEVDYSETALGYDKLCLHYYVNDDMLVNADDGDWTNNDIGLEAIERIRNAEKPELYFRNDPSAKDYEVIRIKSSYYIDMNSR